MKKISLASLILALAIISGQLIKLPLSGSSGLTILDIVVVTFCLLGVLKRKFNFSRPPLFVSSALVFIFIAILSLIFTPLHLRPEEYLISFLYTVRFFFYILLGWLIVSGAFPALNTQKTLLFSGLSLAGLGLLQFIFLPDLRFLAQNGWDPHYFRTVSTFLDPNFLGGFLVLTLLLLTSYLRGGNDRTPRVFYITFAIVYIALLTTFSRSSYLMFLAIGLTFSFLKKLKTMVVLTILLFGVLMLGFYIYTVTISQPRNIDRTQSATSRLNTWQQGLHLFQKFPILGIGFNAYRYALKEYNLGDEQFLKSHGSSSNDSSLLFVASTTGMVGLASYLYFLWTLVKISGKKNLILIVGLIGLIVHSFFANSLFYPPILAWILLIGVNPKK